MGKEDKMLIGHAGKLNNSLKGIKKGSLARKAGV